MDQTYFTRYWAVKAALTEAKILARALVDFKPVRIVLQV
jgi:hypothetical protein